MEPTILKKDAIRAAFEPSGEAGLFHLFMTKEKLKTNSKLDESEHCALCEVNQRHFYACTIEIHWARTGNVNYQVHTELKITGLQQGPLVIKTLQQQ